MTLGCKEVYSVQLLPLINRTKSRPAIYKLNPFGWEIVNLYGEYVLNRNLVRSLTAIQVSYHCRFLSEYVQYPWLKNP
jgi:hypothetical protein